MLERCLFRFTLLISTAALERGGHTDRKHTRKCNCRSMKPTAAWPDECCSFKCDCGCPGYHRQRLQYVLVFKRESKFPRAAACSFLGSCSATSELSCGCFFVSEGHCIRKFFELVVFI